VIPHLSERGLVLAPIGRDAQVAAGILAEAGIRTTICASIPGLVSELSAGAGFGLVTEEALHGADLHDLAAWIDAQSGWSDFPFILLTQRGGGLERNPAAARFLETLGNVSFLERPFHPTTLVSMSRAAIRGRRRQYEARARLAALHQLNETLEARVSEAVAERKVLADIVESTDALVQVVSPDFRVIAINRAGADELERVLDVRPEVGDDMLELLRDRPERGDGLRALWARALAGEEFTTIEPLGDPERDRRFYEMKFNTLRDRDGRMVGAYQFAHDVTRRLRDEEALSQTQDALRQAQKMEAVGQLTGGVAHDFNNLLMVFSAGLRLIDQQPAHEQRERILSSMRQAVERGAALTRQLLAFSRRRQPQRSVLDIGRQVLGMRDLLHRSLGGDVDVEMVIAPDIGAVEVDPVELELAVLNLCLNSRDAMPAGGRITITARNGERRDRDKVILTVADTGVGMSEELISRVFEPFFTTKEVGKGSGLGLAQVYGFVSRSGGRVSIDSKPGEGAIVTMRFPRSAKRLDAGAPAPADAAPLRSASEPRGHVLLVEDDKEVAALTTEMLDAIGYAVTHVASPAAALGALADGRSIDIVFSDVMMPGGMNGVELAREIKRRRPDMPVVLSTGYVEAARGAISEGVEVLAKPYELDALEQALDDKLGPRRARR
jgi:signal transduction histidine kinase/CheY-like chemotaxis protein